MCSAGWNHANPRRLYIHALKLRERGSLVSGDGGMAFAQSLRSGVSPQSWSYRSAPWWLAWCPRPPQWIQCIRAECVMAMEPTRLAWSAPDPHLRLPAYTMKQFCQVPRSRRLLYPGVWSMPSTPQSLPPHSFPSMKNGSGNDRTWAVGHRHCSLYCLGVLAT